ncbi:hypothetical protein PHJA_001822800 [Phtheirospermum japonicum]|uniref:Uncharacterized protein n=1 Tax=Phtheirospermum japonicum TaxID=374723 RepID=A0A830C7U6_9LAMI|nr:hypothetical protein PHJA_001822800 [Phtheirospermum japonicum]
MNTGEERYPSNAAEPQTLLKQFIKDPIIGDVCARLTQDQALVQLAGQLLKSLQESRVVNQALNADDAHKHFSIVLRIWQNKNFRDQLKEALFKESNELVMKHGTIEKLEQELGELANDIKENPVLLSKAEMCMEYLSYFDPQNDYVGLMWEILNNPNFIDMLFERMKQDIHFCDLVKYYARQGLKQSVVDVVQGITKDAGFKLYRIRKYKKDVGGALRVFLSILIIYWMDEYTYMKVEERLFDYDNARAAAEKAEEDARSHDTIIADINYTTRFAGDLENLRAVLAKLKTIQFQKEISARERVYDVEMNVKAGLSNGCCPTLSVIVGWWILV